MPASSAEWKHGFRASSSDEHFCLYNATMKFFTYRVKCVCPLTAWAGFVSWHPLVQAWGSRVFLCIWTDNFLWLFLETRGWTFVFFHFFRKWNFRVPHWVLTACFIPYVSPVIITPGWFTLLSKCICLDAYCGELSNCITLKAQAGWGTADA